MNEAETRLKTYLPPEKPRIKRWLWICYDKGRRYTLHDTYWSEAEAVGAYPDVISYQKAKWSEQEFES